MQLSGLISGAALCCLALFAGGAGAQPGQGGTAGWSVYDNPRFGFSIAIPSHVFVPGPPPASSDGQLWVSRDGAARLLAAAAPNASQDTLASYRDFVLRTSYPNARLDYSPVRANWFVLSGTMDSRIFYERITFACDGRYIYGWQMIYPAAERRFYDAIVEAVHKSYRPGRGEDGNCN
jgi:hypothetical protein